MHLSGCTQIDQYNKDMKKRHSQYNNLLNYLSPAFWGLSGKNAFWMKKNDKMRNAHFTIFFKLKKWPIQFEIELDFIILIFLGPKQNQYVPQYPTLLIFMLIANSRQELLIGAKIITVRSLLMHFMRKNEMKCVMMKWKNEMKCKNALFSFFQIRKCIFSH